MSKIKKVLLSVLPGIFLIGYNIGTGSVTAMSKAGANFGLDLLWAVLASCLITYYLIVLFSRHTMATGQTFVQSIKDHISPGLTVILLVSLSVIIVSALIGILGIIADVLQVWSFTTLHVFTPPVLWAFIVGTVTYIFLWNGNYFFFEKVLAVLVAIMGIAFIVTSIINFPTLNELAVGLVPTLPETAEGSDNSSWVIVAGMIGTTVSVFVFIIRSQIVKETGWKMTDNAIQKRDALVSASMMFIIGASIMITAATTLHVQGIKLNNVVEMVPLLEPIAGKATINVFVAGILAAGLSSYLPNMLVIPWLIIDYKKSKRDTTSHFHRIILFALTIISVVGVSFGVKPVFVMMLSQACLSVVLPLTIASVFYLTSSKKLMNKHINKFFDFILLSLIMLFSLYVSYLGIRGLFVDLLNI
jgi:Mn2+/Fe2+ NRAMP family transporter